MNHIGIELKFNNLNNKNTNYKLLNIFSTIIEKKITNKNKQIRFDNNVEVFLIDNTKYKELFYNNLDYTNFRISAQNDINYVMSIRYVDFNEAKKILFQPG
jgi:hypothetical protein